MIYKDLRIGHVKSRTHTHTHTARTMPQWRALGHLAQNLQASLRYLCSSSVNANSHPKTLLAAICSPAQSRLTPYAASADSSRSVHPIKAVPLFLVFLIYCLFTSSALAQTTGSLTGNSSAGTYSITAATADEPVKISIAWTAGNVNNTDLLEVLKIAFPTKSSETTVAAFGADTPFEFEFSNSVTTPYFHFGDLGDNRCFLEDCKGVVSVTSTVTMNIINGKTTNGTNYTVGGPFAGCTNLKKLSLPNVAFIDVNAEGGGYCPSFAGCANLEELSLGVTEFLDESTAEFGGSSALTSSEIFKASNLKQFPKLRVVNLAKIEELTEGCFSGLPALEEIDLSGLTSATEIPASCFADCPKLATITGITQGSITTIGNEAFKNCAALAAFDMTSMTSIGESAFEGCSGLASVTMNSTSNYSVAKNAFKGCSSLANINLEKANNTSIPEGVFDGCAKLTKIYFAATQSVTTIGARAFAGCGFQKIEIPPSVTTVGASAFAGCEDATEVVFLTTSALTTIEAGAFQGCATLSSVDLSNVQTTNVVTLGANALQGTAAGLAVVVPSNQKTAYEATTSPWKPFILIDLDEEFTITWVTNPVAASEGTSAAVTIAGTGGTGGTVSDNTTTLKYSETLVLTPTISADNCYSYDNWSTDLPFVDILHDETTAGKITVSKPRGDVTLSLDLITPDYTFASAGGGGTIVGTTTAGCGSEVTLEAVADADNYTFDKWVVSKQPADANITITTPGDAAQTFTVAKGVEYLAIFKVIPRIGNITVKNGGKVRVGQPAATP